MFVACRSGRYLFCGSFWMGIVLQIVLSFRWQLQCAISVADCSVWICGLWNGKLKSSISTSRTQRVCAYVTAKRLSEFGSRKFGSSVRVLNFMCSISMHPHTHGNENSIVPCLFAINSPFAFMNLVVAVCATHACVECNLCELSALASAYIHIHNCRFTTSSNRFTVDISMIWIPLAAHIRCGEVVASQMEIVAYKIFHSSQWTRPNGVRHARPTS